MRLRRLRIAHFRGVEAREVTFGDGVTIVEGPNEVGKSSLAEALLLLIDPSKKSDSRSKDVERVRPKGRDVVPEVEAEFEAGAFRFTFRKRFTHKKGGGTELDVHAPRAEQLAGDAAVQRFDEILRETVDVDLFRALCVEQGRAVGQTPLGGKAWLTRALDEAAGGGQSGDDSAQETLFEQVRRRYLEYFTEKTGSPARELIAAAKGLAEATERHGELARRLGALDQHIAEHARLTAALRDLDRDLPRFEREAATTRAAVDSLVEVERRAESTGQRVSAQGAQVDALEGELKRRRELLTEIRDVERALEPKTERARTLAAELERVRAERDAAELALQDAARRGRVAEVERDHAHADVERFALLERAAALRARRDRAAELRERIEELDARVRGGIGVADLEQVERLEREAQRARDALRTAGAHLSIEALRDLEVQVDDEVRRLARGATLPHEPGTPLDVTVPDVLRVRLRVGASTAELSEAAETAEDRLRDALRRLGVADVAVARRRADLARTAGYELGTARGQLGELAEGLEVAEGASVLDTLDVELRTLEATEERLRAVRPADRPEPRDAAHAAQLLAEAGAAERSGRTREAEARQLREATRDRLASIEKDHAVLVSEVESLTVHLVDRRARLDAARNAQSDAALERSLDDAARGLAMLRADAAALAGELAAANLAQKRLFADNAAAALDGARDRRRDTEGRRREIDAVLRHDEGEGLGEQLQVAASGLEAAEQLHAQVERRAMAAKLLHETMAAMRAAAKAARVRPLTDQLENLGRIVFNDTFEATLDDELAIAERTLDGVTVPFEDLSVGAREQLDLLMRIAVAQTVTKHGGVPLILDDTLGHADPDRLLKMSALLALAGRTVQVIVLTCHPDRFASVGGATVIRLP